MEEDLEHSTGIARDLGSSEALELGGTDFVGDAAFGEFTFGFSDRTDFGARVDSGRNIVDAQIVVFANIAGNVTRCSATLGVGRTGQ